MLTKHRLAGLGASLALVLVPAAATAAAKSSPPVTIRIEGLHRTLLLSTLARAPGSGWITKGGTPKGACPADSAAGVLDRVTHHRWQGQYFPSVGSTFVSAILGETPKGNDYWELFVDNRVANAGACGVKPRLGEQILFADTNGKPHPSALLAPRTAITGQPFKVKLVGYTAAGKAKPLAGVTVTGNGIAAGRTDAHGVVSLVDRHAGVLVLRASPRRYVRTEAIVHVAA